ncbi:MAG TPA: nucleotide exchange factor GrpE [Thermoplasmata archaeon]|nr:nucleotide exchange factor GrpE [Thermoplasmata archaeon]
MAEEPNIPPAAPPETTPADAAEAAPKGEDWETRFKYLLADFENFRRRTAREHERVRDRARADLLRAMLPLYEAVEHARESVRRNPENDPVRKGLDLLWKEWTSFLNSEGVEPLARQGQPFRAEDHEAVAETPVTEESPEGTIVDVVQQGYSLAGGVLRPAKVVVARKPSRRPPPAAAAETAVSSKEDTPT